MLFVPADWCSAETGQAWSHLCLDWWAVLMECVILAVTIWNDRTVAAISNCWHLESIWDLARPMLYCNCIRDAHFCCPLCLLWIQSVEDLCHLFWIKLKCACCHSSLQYVVWYDFAPLYERLPRRKRGWYSIEIRQLMAPSNDGFGRLWSTIFDHWWTLCTQAGDFFFNIWALEFGIAAYLWVWLVLLCLPYL